MKTEMVRPRISKEIANRVSGKFKAKTFNDSFYAFVESTDLTTREHKERIDTLIAENKKLSAELNSRSRLIHELSDALSAKCEKLAVADSHLNISKRNEKLFQECSGETSKKLRLALDRCTTYKVWATILLASNAVAISIIISNLV